MFDPSYPLFPTLSLIGFVLVLVPLPWHLQAWNSGTCFYVMWSSLACLNQLVNSIVWADDVINKAPVWCDISIRITMAVSVALPASSLCINRRLYQIASIQAVSVTKAEKRRAALIDTLICVLFPLIYLCLQYIVQGHRFNIFEQVGCFPALYNSVPMYFLSMMWPPLIGCISAVYGVLSLRAFLRRRAAFSQFLAPASSSAIPGLTTARYLRLMALAATDILVTTPLGVFLIYVNATAEAIGPWRSLADTHFMFSRVEQFPAFIWRAQPMLATGLECTRWSAPLSGILFFAFFGVAVEARRNYVLAYNSFATTFWRIAARIGIRRPADAVTLSPSSKGDLYATPAKPVSNPRSALSISLPLYSTVGTGSLTATAPPSASSSHFTDLKRAASSSSTTVSSRFIEHLDPEKAGAEAELHPHPEPEAETPASATSFTSSSAPVSPNYSLPLHLDWASRPYPVVYAEAEEPVADATVSDRERDTWSPSSDAHSIRLEALPPGRKLV